MHCLYGALHSASYRVNHSGTDVMAHHYEMNVLNVYVCAWNGLPDAVLLVCSVAS